MGFFAVIAALLSCMQGFAADPDSARVDAAFVQLFAGPGPGYPQRQFIDHDHDLRFLRQRTDWFQVEAEDGTRGWLPAASLDRLRSSSGALFGLDQQRQQLGRGTFEANVASGSFGGSQSFSTLLGFGLSDLLRAELTLGQALGQFSSIYHAGVQLGHFGRYGRKHQPVFALGFGTMKIKPAANIVSTVDRQDDYLKVVAGLRRHISGRFFMRFEYNHYLILTSRDDNDAINEWKLGVSAGL